MRKLVLLLVPICLFALASCKSSTDATTTDNTQVKTDAAGNVALDPPAPGDGIQIVLGPFNVDSLAAIERQFANGPKDNEFQANYYFKLPNDQDIDVDHIVIAMNSGSHHMNMFRTDVQRDSNYWDLNDWASNTVFQESDMLVEAQVPYLNWTLPGSSVAHFKAHDQCIIQLHYVDIPGVQVTKNANGQAVGKVVINLYTSKKTNPTRSSMLFARYKLVVVPSNDSDVTFVKHCTFDAYQNRPKLDILGMTGHFHSTGKYFVVERFDLNTNKTIDTIYKSAAWAEPPFTVYNPPLSLDTGQCLRYVCTYHNNTGKTMVFGPHVGYEEHMNLFCWFSPGYKNGTSIYDDNPY